MSRITLIIWLGIALALTTPLPAWSGTAAEPVYVPPDLAPWQDWVLYDADGRLCPVTYNDQAGRCAWPGRLDLEADADIGFFRQEWQTYKKSWVPLPGGKGCWPEEVALNGQPVPVMNRNGVPSLWLPAGRHRISGGFRWSNIPETIMIPAESGLLSLIINGKPVEFPVMDRQGRLWLQKRTTVDHEEDRLEVRLFRLIRDTIPMQVTNLIKLNISGRARELMLSDVLLPGSFPMSIQSALPARLENEDNLRLQVRPGQWEISIDTHFQGPVDTLGPVKGAYGLETWCFEPQPHLRQVKLEGVPGVDPNQTDLPPAWKQFSTYLMKPGAKLSLTVQRRGDPDPAPDRLSLERTWWLDFDGRGFTINDHITGSLSRSWSLSMMPPIQLGRVSVDGRDHLITRQAETLAGVELRQGRLDLDADSRLEPSAADLPAVGWDHDFQAVSGALNLPPGWNLLAAQGVDFVPRTWLQKWTLLDIFLALLVSIVVWKLSGLKWGVLALLVTALTFQEPGAPRIVWLSLLAAMALLKVLPDGRLKKLANLWRLVSMIVLLVLAIPFMVDQARVGLYPQLETPMMMRPFFSGMDDQSLMADISDEGGMARSQRPGLPLTAPPPPPAKAYRGKTNAPEPQISQSVTSLMQDPNAVIQTGPGLPTWQWKRYHLGWNGPVDKSQQLRFILLSPRFHLVVCFLRILLLALLVVVLLELPRLWRHMDRGVAAAALVMILLPWPVPAQSQQIPPMIQTAEPAVQPSPESANGPLVSLFPGPALLEELKSRLLKKPDCTPYCAFYPYMKFEAGAASLKVTIDVHAVEQAAVPLPGSLEGWHPSDIRLDGEPATAVACDKEGMIWTLTPPGVHRLTLAGPLPPVNTLPLPMPLVPARADVAADGWDIQGVGPDGQVEGSLQLIRTKKAGQKEDMWQASVLPPYLHVERIISLGLTWDVLTRVTRLTPTGVPVVEEIPLLPGESVTTAGIRVNQGKAVINMDARTREIRWHATMQPVDRIVLEAASNVHWSESWVLDASPIWHVELPAEPPVIHHQTEDGVWRPQWRPWPRERVTLHISRPEAIPGRTVTIDDAVLDWTPGQRVDTSKLKLSLRTSQGTQQKVVLPDGSELQRFSIAGKIQPTGQTGRDIVIMLQPGAQDIELDWINRSESTFKQTGPPIDLGTEAANARLSFHMPKNRWILFTGGPLLGPAVLFWIYLVVVLLAAVALGRLGWTPLKTRHWVLLLLGLTQVHPLVAIMIVGWFLALDYRRKHVADGWLKFDAGQMLLAAWTLAAAIGLYIAIERGLMGIPDMQISGNFSTDFTLNWTKDHINGLMPRPFVVTLPLWVYKILMLIWALWLAMMMIKWFRWGWHAFNEGGLWRKISWRRRVHPSKKDEFMIE